MRGLQLNAVWKPRDGYTPTEREVKDRRALCANNIWRDTKLEIVELPIPEPADDEVLMKVGACGICGSRSEAMHVGCMIEPLAVAYNGLFVRGEGFCPGHNIAIFGAGPIGLSAVALAAASGAGQVLVFEKSPIRMELALQTGATGVYHIDDLFAAGSSPAQKIRELTGGWGADMLVECTEFQFANLPQIEDALAVGAKIVQIGISSRKAPLTTVKLQNVGGSYHGNIGSAGHGIWKGCINLIATGRVDPKKYMSPRIFSMDEALLAIEDAAKAGGGKNVVDPSM